MIYGINFGRIRCERSVIHVNDIAPTLYDILDIDAPAVVNGYKQDPIDGKSFAATFTKAQAKEPKDVQFFDNNGARGVYHDGWFAGAKGPLKPWIPAQKGLAEWDSSTEPWELYNVRTDFSQSHDLAAKYPEKLEEMKKLFLEEAEKNKDFPIGAGIWLRLHPEDVATTGYTSWNFTANTERMPEFAAPGIGKRSNIVHIDLETHENASGVLYVMGGASGGITLYMDKGQLVYDYNMLIIEHYKAQSNEKIPAGKHQIDVITQIEKPGAPGTVIIKLDEKEIAKVALKRTVPALFTASETFDVGKDLGSPVALEYDDRRPFAFDGKINSVKVSLTK